MQFNLKARYKKNKASFCRQFSVLDSGNRQSDVIYFWPNYSITGGRIDFKSALPENLTQQCPQIQRIDLQKFNLSQAQDLVEKKVRAIGQVFVIYIDKQNILNYLEPVQATFSVVQFTGSEAPQGLTVAHAFNELGTSDFWRLVFVSLEESDQFEFFVQCLEEFYSQKKGAIEKIRKTKNIESKL